MPTHNISDFFDGTPRPNWAGSVLIDTDEVFQSSAYSDVRQSKRIKPNDNGNYIQKIQIERPTLVSGVALAVSTQGRITNDVPQRDLRYQRFDRGHVMALSLGGPVEDINIVPQPRMINQRLSGQDAVKTNDKFSWRGMEIYVRYCAAISFTNNAPPKPTEVAIKGFGQNVKVNGNTIPSIKTTQYNTNTKPKYMILFSATLDYPQEKRGNSPRSIDITIKWKKNNKGDQLKTLYACNYQMEHSSSQRSMLDKKFKDRWKINIDKANARLIAMEYKRQHGIGGRNKGDLSKKRKREMISE